MVSVHFGVEDSREEVKWEEVEVAGEYKAQTRWRLLDGWRSRRKRESFVEILFVFCFYFATISDSSKISSPFFHCFWRSASHRRLLNAPPPESVAQNENLQVAKFGYCQRLSSLCSV